MMLRMMLFAAGLFAAGTVGWLLANHWNEPGNSPVTMAAASVESTLRIGPPPLAPDSTAETIDRLSLANTRDGEPQDETVSLDAVLLQLQARLDDEVLQRRLLERRVQELTHKLGNLEETGQSPGRRPTATVASASETDSRRDDPAVRAEARTARFVSVGFNAEDEKQLTRRMDEVEMERLYLRDRARREGWLRTPQYRDAANDLHNELRNEIGEEGYDRLLYATEQDNRVLVNGVLESSPAQEVGLQQGDVIITYDGTRVFSRRDIRTATRQGEMGDLVPLRVERNGQVLDVEIPRGPLGVQLGSSNVLP